MKVKNILEKIPDILLAVLVAFSLVFALTSSLCLTYPVFNMLVFVTLGISLLFIMFYNKLTSVISFSLISLAISGTVFHVLFVKGISDSIRFLDEYFYWLGDFIQYPENVNSLYQFITVIALCTIFSVFTYIFVIRKFLFFVVLITGTALLGIQWSYNIISGLAPFYLFLVAALIIYIKYVYKRKLNLGPNDYAKSAYMVIWSVPVSVLIIAFAFSIHASDKPIQWKWLDSKLVTAYNFLKKNFDYETFDYFSLSASSGFGDKNNLLGGRVRLDRTNVLQVSTGSRIYLKGISRDTYTGSSWTSSDPEFKPASPGYSDLYSDTDEMLHGMKLLTRSENFINKYFNINPVKVNFLNIKTKSVFLPSNVSEFKTSKQFTGLIDSSGDYSSKKRLSKGFKYEIEMYSPKIGTEDFANVMRKSKRGLYDETIRKLNYVKLLQNISGDEAFLILQGGDDGSADGFNVFTTSGAAIAAASSTNNPSAAANNTKPGRTDTAASEINTTGAMDNNAGSTTSGSAIDRAYSSDNISISISASKKNDQIDNLEGLRRLREKSNKIYNKYLQLPANLPQRVKDLSASLVASENNNYDKAKAIEQYLASNYPYNLDVRSTPRNRDFVDYFLFDLKEGYCSYYASAMTVLCRCAGLPARYVEGYMLPPESVKDSSSTFVVSNMQAHAWVEIYFEGYGWLPFEPTSPFRSKFYTVETSDVNYAEGYSSSYFDYMEMMKKYAGKDDNYEDLGNVTVEKAPNTALIIVLILGCAILLVILLILFNIIRGRFRLYKLVSLPANNCVLRFYSYFLKVLKLQGLDLLPSETPCQYSERIDNDLFFSPVRFKAITDIFVKSRYSTQEATENEKQLYCDFCPGFLSEIKVNMGKFKYFTYKYLLGKF